MINIKKSLNIALASKGIKKGDFASSIGVSRNVLWRYTEQKSVTSETIDKLANELGMKASEFIALGEE